MRISREIRKSCIYHNEWEPQPVYWISFVSVMQFVSKSLTGIRACEANFSSPISKFECYIYPTVYHVRVVFGWKLYEFKILVYSGTRIDLPRINGFTESIFIKTECRIIFSTFELYSQQIVPLIQSHSAWLHANMNLHIRCLVIKTNYISPKLSVFPIKSHSRNS